MSKSRTLVPLFLTLLVAAACAPAAPAPTPQATPQPLWVSYSPALRPLQAALHVCALEDERIALFVEEVPASAGAKGELRLWWGAPPAGKHAYQLGWDELVAVVHPENPLEKLDIQVLEQIMSGVTNSWEGIAQLEGVQNAWAGGEIQVWTYPSGDELRQVFDQALSGREIVYSFAWLAPDPQAMREAVANEPSAVGYLPASWLDSSVKALKIEPSAPEGLRQPLLLLSDGEPQAAPRAFAACLQDGTGQHQLSQMYEPLEKTGP